MKKQIKIEKWLCLTLLSSVTVGGALNLQAETLTWTGGATGDFTASANWSPAQAPQAGDTLVINKAVTFDAATFDVGTSGLEIQASARTLCDVAFAGSGEIRVRGGGGFFQIAPCLSFAGDWRVTGGVFGVARAAHCLGVGRVQVEASGGAQFQIGALSMNNVFASFKNDVQVFGSGTKAPVAFTNGARLDGALSAEGDFEINVAYVDPNVNGGRAEIRTLSAPGRTVSVTFNSDYKLAFIGSVEARVAASKTGTVSFRTLDTATDGLSADISGNAKLECASAVLFSSLTVDGVSVQSGVWRPGDLSARATGSGFAVVSGSVVTWIGGAAGAWSGGANWSTGEAPKGMTIAKFTNAVDLVNETFDFGADGVCIWNVANADLVQRTMFTGSGKYCKFGAGQIDYQSESSYTGGTLFADGNARIATSHTNLVFGSEEGVVELACSVDGTRPYFEFGHWNIRLPNRIKITGATKAQRFLISNNMFVTGDIESDSDFLVQSNWGPMYADGNFSAPGRTITFSENDEKQGYVSYIAGAIDASLVKQATGFLELRGKSTGAANVLTVDGGTLALTEGATWEGPVAVKAGGLLKLNGNGNLSSAATLTIEAGGTVEIAKGVRVESVALVIAGETMPPGSYSVRTRPDVFAGAGRVKVGQAGSLIILR